MLFGWSPAQWPPTLAAAREGRRRVSKVNFMIKWDSLSVFGCSAFEGVSMSRIRQKEGKIIGGYIFNSERTSGTDIAVNTTWHYYFIRDQIILKISDSIIG
jgi:hypothetical protein